MNLLLCGPFLRESAFFRTPIICDICFKNREKCTALDWLCNTFNLPAFSRGKFMIFMLCLARFSIAKYSLFLRGGMLLSLKVSLWFKLFTSPQSFLHILQLTLHSNTRQ